jgi:hypothetical protein
MIEGMAAAGARKFFPTKHAKCICISTKANSRPSNRILRRTPASSSP